MFLLTCIKRRSTNVCMMTMMTMKVDACSPAEAAGLREGDRIVAVNGADVAGDTHLDVVQRIRSNPARVSTEITLIYVM